MGDEELRRAIRTMTRRLRDIDREDEEFMRSEEALSDQLIDTFRAQLAPQQAVVSADGQVAFQPSPTAQAVEWAKSTEFYPVELARVTGRYGHSVVDEELEIFAFINTLHFYGRIPDLGFPNPN